jgi:hypothetical protein
MNKTKSLIAGAVLAAISLAAAPASAEFATTNVNIRDRPEGVITGRLSAGAEVVVTSRRGNWCEIDIGGWVACRLLADSSDDRDGRDGRDGRQGRAGRDTRTNVDVGISFNIPGFRIEFGDTDFDHRPRGRGRGHRVCFYEHVNYEGDSFCMRPGERTRSLGDWDDEISSIRVRGDAEALVCERTRFRGRCAIVDRSIRNLGRRGNDIISSIRVR